MVGRILLFMWSFGALEYAWSMIIKAKTTFAHLMSHLQVFDKAVVVASPL